jgi:hypothetical protein
LAPERNSSSRNCRLWNPLAGFSSERNSKKSQGPHGLQHVQPTQGRTGHLRGAAQPPHRVRNPPVSESLPDGLQLEQEELEPQLEHLVDPR